MKTEFATPERSTDEEIRQTHFRLAEQQEKCVLINAIPNIVLVLNNNRQIVFANQAALDYMKVDTVDDILGLRPGELIGCLHSDEMEGGCGTTKNCMVCGAARAILSSQSGRTSTEECRMLTKSSDAFDYKVHTVPLEVFNERYVVFSIMDISDAKRKIALESIFFHDVLNTAGGIQGFAELLDGASPEEANEFGKILASLTTRLVDEIQAQRDILSAENSELKLHLNSVTAVEIIKSTVQLYSMHSAAEGKLIVENHGTESAIMYTDERLARRILGNMLKNALEAAEPGATVTLRGDVKFSYFVFSVHNNGYIPPLVQLQIFNRSFSTKGTGRGLGTYSVKLLTEKYLQGRAGFISTRETGTTFFAIIPLIHVGTSNSD